MNDLQVCKICELPFDNKELLRKHKQEVHGFFCYLCGISFYNVDYLDDHINTFHHSALSYICRICGMNFNRKKYLIDHMKEHVSWEIFLGPLLFLCKICCTNFLEEKELRDHEKTHNKEWITKIVMEPIPRKNARKKLNNWKQNRRRENCTLKGNEGNQRRGHEKVQHTERNATIINGPSIPKVETFKRKNFKRDHGRRTKS